MNINEEYRGGEPREDARQSEAWGGGEGLLEQFRRLLWLSRRWQMQNHRRHGPMGDPHRGQGRVLRLLAIKPEISQKDLTYLLDMRPQSLGELLAKLERGGYIVRTPSETDRRVMNVKLTEQGRQAAAETEPDTGMGDLFSCLTEEEQATLSGYLARIIESFAALIGEEETPRGWGRWDGRDRAPCDGFCGRHGMGPEDRRPEGHFHPLGGGRGRGGSI